MPLVPPPGLKMRLAVERDLDDIFNITEEAYQFDLGRCTRYLYRDTYLGDHLERTIHEYRAYLKDTKKYRAYVIISEDHGDEPISVAIWDVEPLTKRSVGKQS
jgi:hypothetical protein